MIRNSNIADILLGASDYSLSSRSDTLGQSSYILDETNNLLLGVGISAKQISSVEELSRVASSMFVAIYESLFRVRLDGIIRNPQSKEEYVHNAQLVIDGLSEQIQMDLQHITGSSVANGDIRAISHLVNLFSRIVDITQDNSGTRDMQDVDKSASLRGSAFNENRQIPSSLDSISTHQSAFEGNGINSSPESEAQVSSDDEIAKVPRKLKYSHTTPTETQATTRTNRYPAAGNTKSLARRASRPVVDAVNRNVLLHNQREKLLQAQRRRDGFTSIRERESLSRNQKRADVSFRAQQKRWLEDEIRSEASHRQLRENQHTVMLRKVYAGLLKQMRCWKNEEHEEAKQRFLDLRANAMWQIRAIQTVFEDRLAMLREQESQRKLDERTISYANRRLASEVRQSVQEKQNQALADNKQLLKQQRENERSRRLDSHRNLLALLDASDWSQSLRSSQSRCTHKKMKYSMTSNEMDTYMGITHPQL